jgi:putative DNA primase/helicase
VNPGRSKAEAAAKAVGGQAIFPIFSPSENAYPAELPRITPHAFREHERAQARLDAADAAQVQVSDTELKALRGSLLSNEQLAGLSRMKAHTDFNDLAMRSVLGREGIERQAFAALDQAKQFREQGQMQERTKNLEPEKQDGTQRLGMRVR